MSDQTTTQDTAIINDNPSSAASGSQEPAGEPQGGQQTAGEPQNDGQGEKQQTTTPPDGTVTGTDLPPEAVNFIQQLMEKAQTQQPPQDAKDDTSDGQASDKQSDDKSDVADAVPEHWDKYVSPQPVPEMVKKMAHEAGLTQSQFDASMKTFGNYMQATRLAEQQQIRQMGEQFIEKEWGDQKEYKTNLARRALRTVDKEGKLNELLTQTGYVNHPVVLSFLYDLGRNMQEGGFLKGELKRPAGAGKSPAQVLYPNMPTNSG